VSVSAASAGTLVIETRGDRSLGSFPFGPPTYPSTGVDRKFVPVSAGEIVPVEILWFGSPGSYSPGRTVTFTLATRLES
jgi:hypothetical protein